MNDVVLNDQILVNELGRVALVSHNSTNLCCGVKNVFRFFSCKKVSNCFLFEQIELCMGAGNDVCLTIPFKCTDDRRTDESAMSRDVDFCVFFHALETNLATIFK